LLYFVERNHAYRYRHQRGYPGDHLKGQCTTRFAISNPGFLCLPSLEPSSGKCCSEFEQGELDAVEFIELPDDTPDTEIAELKRQAFRVAGDMGSAMKLLAEDTVSGDFELFKHILDFLLDLCDEGDLSTVAFFWPQLQCFRTLQMLPPNDCSELIRWELMEDFWLTVAIRHFSTAGAGACLGVCS
jgi:hypothetical protein